MKRMWRYGKGEMGTKDGRDRWEKEEENGEACRRKVGERAEEALWSNI